jgi:ankyrin repeat protein
MSSRLQMSNLDDLNNLLKSGAHPTATLDFFDPKALIYSCASGHFEVVKLFVENGADPNAKDDDNYDETALMKASRLGHFEIVKFLAEHGADPNAKNDDSETALMEASEKGHFEIVKFLVEHGADLNAKHIYIYMMERLLWKLL